MSTRKSYMKKVISLSLLSLLYCTTVCIIQSYNRNGHDVAVGILYIYSSIIFLAGLWITFMLYGSSKLRKILCGISSVVFQLYYIYLWISVHEAMPYEGTFYIAFGLFIYIIEFFYLKHNQK